MKANPFIVFIIVIFGINFGLNPHVFKQLGSQFDLNTKVGSTVETETEISLQEKQKRFK